VQGKRDLFSLILTEKGGGEGGEALLLVKLPGRKRKASPRGKERRNFLSPDKNIRRTLH